MYLSPWFGIIINIIVINVVVISVFVRIDAEVLCHKTITSQNTSVLLLGIIFDSITCLWTNFQLIQIVLLKNTQNEIFQVTSP